MEGPANWWLVAMNVEYINVKLTNLVGCEGREAHNLFDKLIRCYLLKVPNISSLNISAFSEIYNCICCKIDLNIV